MPHICAHPLPGGILITHACDGVADEDRHVGLWMKAKSWWPGWVDGKSYSTRAYQ